MAKRMVSAYAHGGETKDEVKRAALRGKSFDIMVTDPLVLGTGAFDIQDLDDSITLNGTDQTRKAWMLFIERDGAKLVVREE
jgi:hypothetical protein